MSGGQSERPKTEHFYLRDFVQNLTKDIQELEDDLAMYKRSQKGFTFFYQYERKQSLNLNSL
jgi:hypothetical protein